MKGAMQVSSAQDVTRKVERLEARVNTVQKRLFQEAAGLQGRTLTDFVISTVQAAATRVLQERDVIALSAKDREVFVQAVLKAPAPNPQFRAAAGRYHRYAGR
jgi:uncharacterized protein (DUF1778 family)